MKKQPRLIFNSKITSALSVAYHGAKFGLKCLNVKSIQRLSARTRLMIGSGG